MMKLWNVWKVTLPMKDVIWWFGDEWRRVGSTPSAADGARKSEGGSEREVQKPSGGRVWGGGGSSC